MKPNDSLPVKICTKCVTAVNSAVKLRENCRSSNTYLLSILEHTKSASTLPKPQTSKCQNNNDNSYSKNIKHQSSTIADDLESEVEEQNENVTARYKKGTYDTQSAATLYKLDQECKHELEVNDEFLDYTVELEEIIELSDEGEFYMEQVEVERDETISMLENIAENNKKNSSLNESDENTDKNQFNSNANDIKADSNNSDDCSTENGDLVSEKRMEHNTEDHVETYEEALIADLEEQILNGNEDQALVSSTVDTKEFKHYEDNSNTSNLSSDLYKERLVNENISSTNQCERPNDRKVLSSCTNTEKSKGVSVYPKLRMRRNLFKNEHDPARACVCEICGNRFTNQSQLRLHMKVHLQRKNFQCELCLKSFITACNLQAHMRIHTGEKPYECQFCGRRFSDRTSHIRHERTHTNERPFKCRDCGKSFSLATTLQNHMKVHSNERSHRCEPCGKSFKLRHHLKMHQNTVLHRSAAQTTDDDEC